MEMAAANATLLTLDVDGTVLPLQRLKGGNAALKLEAGGGFGGNGSAEGDESDEGHRVAERGEGLADREALLEEAMVPATLLPCYPATLLEEAMVVPVRELAFTSTRKVALGSATSGLIERLVTVT